MTWLRNGHLSKRGWIPEKGINFMFAQATVPAPLSTNLSIQRVLYQSLFLEVEKLGLEVGHKSPSSIKV